MSFPLEAGSLRQQLTTWADEADVDLARRYALRPLPSKQPNLYRRMRRALGFKLRELGLRRPPPLEPWLVGLNHVAYTESERPIAIWAFEINRDTLRTACRNFKKLQDSAPYIVPVLITDVADFAFFSRLGWLVEYVPTLTAPAEGFAERKRRYLAWRYRDTPAVHAAVGLKDNLRVEDLLLD
jgi:hypothetical protein